jgi:hypothetical protein
MAVSPGWGDAFAWIDGFGLPQDGSRDNPFNVRRLVQYSAQ